MIAFHKALLSGFCIALCAITFLPFLGSAQTSSTQDKDSADKKIKEMLAAPPLFLDESHPGPTLVPNGMPTTIFPFDCRAVEAYLHRVRPGQYHFERAQRLLGQGIDVIGCEAFGLDRFTAAGDDLLRLRQAVREAESAAALPIGLEQWRPGAAHDVLASAYREAAADFEKEGRKTGRLNNWSRARTSD